MFITPAHHTTCKFVHAQGRELEVCVVLRMAQQLQTFSYRHFFPLNLYLAFSAAFECALSLSIILRLIELGLGNLTVFYIKKPPDLRDLFTLMRTGTPNVRECAHRAFLRTHPVIVRASGE